MNMQMIRKSSYSSFSDIRNHVFPEDEDEEEENYCECGPKPCGTSEAKDSFNSSSQSDSVYRTEVVNVSLWESILAESEQTMAPYREWLEEKEAAIPTATPRDGPTEFLDKEIFPLLLPAIKNMLVQAKAWDVLRIQKSRFNGLDFLAEVLWNSNPRHPKRSRSWLDVYSIPPFKLWLKSNPRPIFPKSWLWTREEGALIIQKSVRGWLVRKQDKVQEMRLFWKAIIAEEQREASELGLTDSEFQEQKKLEKLSPCERYRAQWM